MNEWGDTVRSGHNGISVCRPPFLQWPPPPLPFFFSADLIFCKVHTFHLNSQDIQTWAQFPPLTKVERRSSVIVVVAGESFSAGEVSDQEAQVLATPVHHSLQAEQTAWTQEMGGSEGSIWKTRAIWASPRKARNCYSAAPQLQTDQHQPLPKGQTHHSAKPLAFSHFLLLEDGRGKLFLLSSGFFPVNEPLRTTCSAAMVEKYHWCLEKS